MIREQNRSGYHEPLVTIAAPMLILFLHGWQSTPGGLKPTYLYDHGHEVLNPALPDDDFDAAVRIAQLEFDSHHPDVVVGSSRGGAVAMNINSGSTPLVLLCPAWKRWGKAQTVKPNTIILHSSTDEIIPFADSQELIRNSGLPESAVIAVGSEHRLADPESLAKMLEAVEMAAGNTDRGFICRTCGKYHPELPMDFAVDFPYPYLAIPVEERSARCYLTSDVCVIDAKEFFIRGCLEIPVADGPRPFVWGVWVSLSEKSFKRVVELWDYDGREKEQPFFGWLCTRLPLYPDTGLLKTNVHLRSANQRPSIELEQTDHPLAIEQRDGITMARVREIAAALLHQGAEAEMTVAAQAIKVLSIQIQLERVSELDETQAMNLLTTVGSRTGLVKCFHVSEGRDKGRYFNVNYSTDNLPGLWSLIRREVFEDSTVGPILKKAAIITCQGKKGWDDYLLLHHFDENEPLDSLQMENQTPTDHTS
jgi:hypothetical protein